MQTEYFKLYKRGAFGASFILFLHIKWNIRCRHIIITIRDIYQYPVGSFCIRRF